MEVPVWSKSSLWFTQAAILGACLIAFVAMVSAASMPQLALWFFLLFLAVFLAVIIVSYKLRTPKTGYLDDEGFRFSDNTFLWSDLEVRESWLPSRGATIFVIEVRSGEERYYLGKVKRAGASKKWKATPNYQEIIDLAKKKEVLHPDDDFLAGLARKNLTIIREEFAEGRVSPWNGRGL